MLEFVRLRMEATVTQGGQLPRFLGSTLRGALMATFRKMVCVTHLPECPPCLLRFQCPYPRFFEPFASPDHPFAARLREMPRPFALEVPPPSDAPLNFRQGDSFVFRVVLWHDAATFLSYLVVATQRMLGQGLGKGEKVHATLRRVIAEEKDGKEQLVYDASEGLVRMDFPKVAAQEVMAASSPRRVRRLIVHFLTPVRIDIDKKLQNPLTFPALIKAANERGRALFWAYERTEPPWDGKKLLREAEKVVTVADEQTWLDLTRFSRRQKERLKIGGIVGWATFEGDDLRPFLPLLRLMEWVHIGKLATMGLGQISVKVVDRQAAVRHRLPKVGRN